MNFKIIVLGIIAYHVGLLIPGPYITINQTLFPDVIRSSKFWELINHLIAAGTLQSQIGLFALGFIPYVSAKSLTSFLIYLRLPFGGLVCETGEWARIRNRNIGYFVSIIFSAIYSYLLIFELISKDYIHIDSNFGLYISVIALTIGSLLVTVIIHFINEKGKFNSGENLLAFSSIMIVSVENAFHDKNLFTSANYFLFLFLFLILVLYTYISNSERRVVLSDGKINIKSRLYSSNLYRAYLYDYSKDKPIVLAAVLVSMLSTFFNVSEIMQYAIVAISIPIFSYLFVMINYPINEEASGLKKSGLYIIGVKPGKMTEDYIDKIISRLSIESGMLKTGIFAFVSLFLITMDYILSPELVFSKCAIINFVGSQFYSDMKARKSGTWLENLTKATLRRY